MNTKPDLSRMTMTAADAAIQLELIDTVHRTLAAEDYVLKLPETLKGPANTYCSSNGLRQF